MRYLLIVLLVAGFFVLRPAQAPAQTCYVTFTNCLSEDFAWCSYVGSSFWDTIIANEASYLTPGETNYFFACGSSSSCYFIGIESADDAATYSCFSYTVDGTVDCNEYACVDGDITWHSGDSEYCCVDDGCTTDCS